MLGAKLMTITLKNEAAKSTPNIEEHISIYAVFYIMSGREFLVLLLLCALHVILTLVFMHRVGLICVSQEQREKRVSI